MLEEKINEECNLEYKFKFGNKLFHKLQYNYKIIENLKNNLKNIFYVLPIVFLVNGCDVSYKSMAKPTPTPEIKSFLGKLFNMVDEEIYYTRKDFEIIKMKRYERLSKEINDFLNSEIDEYAEEVYKEAKHMKDTCGDNNP